MGSMAKSLTSILGGGGKGSAPSIVQPAASATPAASAAKSVVLPEGAPSTAQTPGPTGAMGNDGSKKSSSRRRGRLETLLSDMGGSIERFGD